MSARHSHGHSSHVESMHPIRRGAHAVKKTFVSFGDLVSAAIEVAGSPQAAARLVNHMLRHGVVYAR